MSEWAKVSAFPEEKTAYEYRELYLDDGIQFEDFLCPYCENPLVPVNIYSTGEMAVSPHFRTSRGYKHKFDCDGSPKESAPRDKKAPIHRVEKSDFRLPEKLVSRKNPVITQLGQKQSNKSLDQAEVNRRRLMSGQSLGPAIYQTSLVRSVAVAFLGIFTESYQQQKEQNWSEPKRKQWVSDLLESPLELYGTTLTYKLAFRDIRFPPPSKPRIFHGWARVSRITCCANPAYILLPEVQAEVNDKRPHVEIIVEPVQYEQLTGSQRSTLDKLEETADKNCLVRWFCYGALAPSGDAPYRMQISNLDQIYLHRIN